MTLLWGALLRQDLPAVLEGWPFALIADPAFEGCGLQKGDKNQQKSP
jgi:hypothetical protein